MLKKISIFLFFISALINFQNASFAEEIQFAQVSDIHYILQDEQMDKYLYFLSLSLQKQHPSFVIFLGDNVDKSKDTNVISLMRALHAIHSDYYLVLGDKDAYSFGGLEKEIYLDIVSTFNSNQKNNEKYYYFKPNKDFICVVLDDTSDFAPSTHGEVPDEQIAWLENLLIKYPKKMFIIFEHSPLLPPRVEYKMSMLNTENYQNLIKKYKNILLISSGHYHQEAVLTDDNGVRHISAPAFKDIPHSYQMIKIIYDENSYKSPDKVEIIVTKVKV